MISASSGSRTNTSSPSPADGSWRPMQQTPSSSRSGASEVLNWSCVKQLVATQMGNQGFSHEGTKTACEILWSGDIGDVKEVHAWTGMIYGGQPNIPATGLESV